MSRKVPKEQDLAMIINNETYVDYLNRLQLIAVSLFEWEGLNEIGGNSIFLEQALYEFGRAVFVKDEELGYLSVNVNPSDSLNVYNLPIRVQAWSKGYEKQFAFDDVVYIRNNVLELPTFNTIQLFAYRLYDTERAIDINRNAQKTPVLLETTANTYLTLKNVYTSYTGNTPVIYGNKNFDLAKSINVLKTDAPYLIDKLEDHKHNIWNEALTYMGINNSNTDKKERLIVDEVNSNNDLIAYYLNCFYKTRKTAADEINKKFFNGKEQIKITLNKDVLSLLDLTNFDVTQEKDDTDKEKESEVVYE